MYRGENVVYESEKVYGDAGEDVTPGGHMEPDELTEWDKKAREQGVR
jgi:hypothetical protein